MIHVLMPGIQTLVQDAGRPGYYALGMPPAGALDQRSYRLGNLLVGNLEGAAGLEFTFMGPSLEFREDALISVTGADVQVLIDGTPQDQWTSLQIRSGQRLTFGPMVRGSRGYIAVRGGIDVPELLGSRSTYQAVGFGGHAGRALRPGDELSIGGQAAANSSAPRVGVSVPETARPQLASHVELAVVEGLCNDRFTPDSIDQFFSATFTISHEANRTGFRLNGPKFEFVPRDAPFGAGDDPSNVVNLGYPLGSIQIPSGTEPICLLRDAVTGGGYVTFGTIVSTDIDLLAQLKTPETVSFRSVTIEEAHLKRSQAHEELADLARAMG